MLGYILWSQRHSRSIIREVIYLDYSWVFHDIISDLVSFVSTSKIIVLVNETSRRLRSNELESFARMERVAQ